VHIFNYNLVQLLGIPCRRGDKCTKHKPEAGTEETT